MRDFLDKLRKVLRAAGTKYVLFVAVICVAVGSIVQVYNAESRFKPKNLSDNSKIQKNQIVFPNKKNDDKDKNKNAKSRTLKNNNEKEKNSNTADDTNVMFKNKAAVKKSKKDYTNSKGGERKAVSLKKNDKNSGEAKINIEKNDGEDDKNSQNGDSDKKSDDGTKKDDENGSDGNDGNGDDGSKGGSDDRTVPTSAPKPPVKVKKEPPESKPEAPKGDKLIESTYKITDFPKEGVDEKEVKLKLSIVPIMDMDYTNHIYYDAKLSKEKLLSAVLVYVLDENNNYKYRIKSFNENFKVSAFPKIAKKDFKVTFSFRQNGKAKWQEYEYEFQVAPYQFFVTDQKEQLLDSVTPDMSVNKNGNIFNLLPYYEKLLTKKQQTGLSRDKGLSIDKYIPGWTDEEDNEIPSDIYKAEKKGWKTFYPKTEKSVPSGYKMEMKWYFDVDNFDYEANIKYLQTLTKIPGRFGVNSTFSVLDGVHWVDLSGVTLDKIILSASTAVVSTDSMEIKTAYEVSKGNPYFTAKNGILYNKDVTKIIAIPSGTQEITVGKNIKSISIPKKNNINKIVLKDMQPPEIELDKLQGTMIWVSKKYYDDYLSEWAGKLPDSVYVYSEEDEDMVIKDSAVLSPDGKTLYRVLSSVKGNYIIPDGVEVIKKDALINCTMLYQVILPKSINKLEKSSLDGEQIDKILFLGDVPQKMESDFITEKKGINIYVNSGKYNDYSKAMPDCNIIEKELSIIKSNDYGFIKMDDTIELLSVPENLEVFDGSQTDIRFQVVGEGAFSNAQDLFDVELPESVKKVNTYAFAYCRRLQFIVVHQKNKIEIEYNAFENTGRLKTISYDSANVVFKDEYIPSMLNFCKEESEVENKEVVVNEKILKLRDTESFFVEGDAKHGSFVYAKAKDKNDIVSYLICASDNIRGKVSLRSDTASILQHAFLNCVDEFEINFADYLKLFEIDKFAFEYSGVSGDISLSDNVIYLSISAFKGCRNITSVSIGTSVQKVDYEAFSECANLSRVVFAKGSECKEIASSAFAYTTSLTSIVFPESLEKISSNIFLYAGIKSIEFTSEDAPELVEYEADGYFTFGYSITSDLKVIVPTGRAGSYMDAWEEKLNGSVSGKTGKEVLEKYFGATATYMIRKKGELK